MALQAMKASSMRQKNPMMYVCKTWIQDLSKKNLTMMLEFGEKT